MPKFIEGKSSLMNIRPVAVSYDINKDGYIIAVVTMVKSAYRLGDTVNVMVALNVGDARVFRVRHSFLPACLG